MATEGVFPKSADDVLYASEINNLYRRVGLYGQSINAGVSTGDPVYFDGSEWQVATTQNAIGVYNGSDVVTKGYLSGLTGLTQGDWYGKDSSGNLVNSYTTSDQGIGYAYSTTEIIVLIGAIKSYS